MRLEPPRLLLRPGCGTRPGPRATQEPLELSRSDVEPFEIEPLTPSASSTHSDVEPLEISRSDVEPLELEPVAPSAEPHGAQNADMPSPPSPVPPDPLSTGPTVRDGA